MTVDPTKLRELHATLEELQRRQSVNALSFYKPHPKQAAFHAAGATKRERLLCAGNQLGKTYSGAMELAMHLTGRYPADWPGKKFNRPIRAWAVGLTAQATRDTVQRLLIGAIGQQGTGAIPAECIREVRSSRGIADAVDVAIISHSSGRPSQLAFKSAEQGREKFQGETLDCVWVDEEPDADVYSECMARITASPDGCIFMTFTPLKGLSAVARRFFSEPSPDRALIQMTIEDAEHIPAEKRQQIIDGYQPHERDARARGIPLLGSGRIFQVAESILSIKALDVPAHWPRIVGIDPGVREFAAAWVAWDRDTDCAYLTDVYIAQEQSAIQHAGAIRARGDWIPVAWPPDALAREKGSGSALAEIYKLQGLRMLPQYAQFADGGTSVEAGLVDWTDRMETSRFRVFEHLSGFWDAYRIYHRKDGRIVKEADHILDATRYALMSLRYARTGPSRNRRGQARIADGADSSYSWVWGDHTESPGGSRGNGRGYDPDYYRRPIR